MLNCTKHGMFAPWEQEENIAEAYYAKSVLKFDS